MALVSRITKRVEIPHEPGEWMEFRKLSWKQLEEASDVTSDAMFDKMKKMGGDIISALKSLEEKESQPQNSNAKYDRDTVLQKGIAKWSYSDALNGGTIGLLDEETASWAFDEILSLNQPRTEEETKNG